MELSGFSNIIGDGVPLREIYERIDRIIVLDVRDGFDPG